MNEDEQCPCREGVIENPALEKTPEAGRVAEMTVCDASGCDTSIVLVRGTHVEFVTDEQVAKYGKHKLDPVRMPSDVKIHRSYVLVHDTTGRLFDPCDFYVVRWLGGRSRVNVNDPAIVDAQSYFGPDVPIRSGSVETIPSGVVWQHEARVKFIRYRRAGYDKPFEHEYAELVPLRVSERPVAWRLPLPVSCVVNDHGFVKP